MLELFFALMVGALALLLNRLSIPCQDKVCSYRLFGDVVAFSAGVWLYSTILLLLSRPYATLIICVFLLGLLFAGNQLKVRILNEPLVFSDIFLAGYAIRYPRLYFMYAPVWIWPILILVIFLLVVGVSFEEFIQYDLILRSLLLLITLVPLFITVISRLTWSKSFREKLKSLPLTFLANQDAQSFTPMGMSLLHCLWHGQFRSLLKNSIHLQSQKKSFNCEQCRHLLLIQAESFCQLSKLAERKSVTPVFDALWDRTLSGKLRLDWTGAYTMRTEFAVLTGVAPKALQTYAFDPYQLARQQCMNSLAWDLVQRGFNTVAWHPNDGRFFERNIVLPHLGFEKFVELSELSSLRRMGRYVSDEALLTEAVNYLGHQEQPTFLFLITIEAHGPWLRDRFEGAQLLTEEERYEEHLKSFDRGLGNVLDKIQKEALPIDVVIYGDHLPGLEILRQNRETLDSSTPWLYFGKDIEEGKVNLKPETLRELIRERVLRL